MDERGTPKKVIDNGVFYCEHISDKDLRDIGNFTVRHPEMAFGLERYLKEDALIDEAEGLMRTYLVRDSVSDELVGYFSIKAGMFSINEREELVDDETSEIRVVFDTLPGIEIANFAVNAEYLKNQFEMRGIGLMIFLDFIRPIASQIGEMLGVRYLYIFALPEDGLIDRYQKSYHFERLSPKEEDELHKRVKPYYDDKCMFMYQRL